MAFGAIRAFTAIGAISAIRPFTAIGALSAIRPFAAAITAASTTSCASVTASVAATVAATVVAATIAAAIAAAAVGVAGAGFHVGLNEDTDGFFPTGDAAESGFASSDSGQLAFVAFGIHWFVGIHIGFVVEGDTVGCALKIFERFDGVGVLLGRWGRGRIAIASSTSAAAATAAARRAFVAFGSAFPRDRAFADDLAFAHSLLFASGIAFDRFRRIARAGGDRGPCFRTVVVAVAAVAAAASATWSTLASLASFARGAGSSGPGGIGSGAGGSGVAVFAGEAGTERSGELGFLAGYRNFTGIFHLATATSAATSASIGTLTLRRAVRVTSRFDAKTIFFGASGG